MLRLTLIIYFFLSISSITGVAQSVKKKFIFGVCGHSLTQEAYSKNDDLQIRLIKKLNCKYYRVDIPITINGEVKNAPDLLLLIQKLQKNGIKILPVLVFNRDVYELKSPIESYAKGLEYGQNLARRYKKFFDYYEVGNEEDNSTILSQRNGTIITDFDSSKANIIMPYFKGVCEGIKKEDLSAKLIINHAWVHWGFLKLLKIYHVKYDIIGCHWYSDMGDLKNANSGFGNVIDSLYKQFGKQIWVTEINIKNGSTSILKKLDDDWFTRNLYFIRRNKYVNAVFIYELLDEPAFANKQLPSYNSGEATYGLQKWHGNYSQATSKPIFDRYKSFIQKNP